MNKDIKQLSKSALIFFINYIVLYGGKVYIDFKQFPESPFLKLAYIVTDVGSALSLITFLIIFFYILCLIAMEHFGNIEYDTINESPNADLESKDFNVNDVDNNKSGIN